MTEEPTKDRGYAGKYEITVTDPAGNTQQAAFVCGRGEITNTGYLSHGGGYEACRTAIAVQLHYLGDGERPQLDCAATTHIAHDGWHYLITGDMLNSHDRYVPVHQELTVENPCDEALWQEMKALLPSS